MKHTFLVPVIVGVVAVSGGFMGGMKFQEYQYSKTMRRGFLTGARNQIGNQQANGIRMQNAGGAPQSNNFRPISGEVLKKDDTSITVKTMDGSSKIVLLAESTVISESKTSSVQNIEVGTKVAVFGSTNTDGSITAQNVQLNPTGNAFGIQMGGPRGVSLPDQK